MNRCPITYEETYEIYSSKGLKLLSRNLNTLNNLIFSKEELLQEALTRAPKMSIQGVQPKLSAVLNVSDSKFEIVDKKGLYILKPPHNVYEEVPQNEDLTMRLAEITGFKIPTHGMVYGKDNSLTYFVKRFDRTGRHKKIAVEDFAQLSGASRNTKYNSSMEKVVKIVDQFCTFPAIEKLKLFELTLFNFLTGNEDMHLKNFSLIRNEDIIEFSPLYDLVNTTIVLKNAQEEIALPIRGRKNNLNKSDLVDYFGKEICGLNDTIRNQTLAKFDSVFEDWLKLIDVSFLSKEKKESYYSLISERRNRIFN
ncbi:MAG: HipA domain-containing protein [Melioribacteraceae bacterium]|nr:HipA domain-containing protein [Melioribacteraceae bacterium]MCF8354874.1 HipA domain-containing protein [Melioribacteraceae bacterium]MCF8393904.1 HipA domain-containing protein [Melioribacteraceae bacterium]MCF8419676.1 HipA domain-containing protein [Melioribacteraceae bacterium]